MKRLRVLGALLLTLCLSLGVTGLWAEEGETVKIGVLQYVEHPALDAAYQGFIDGLAAGGLVAGENLEIDFQNPSADQAVMQLARDQMVANGSDLMLGIATDAVQALAVQTDIPVLGTAVTDYVAAGLIADNDAPGINVTGTTDMNPIDLQVQLMMDLFPDTQTVGVIYTNSEVNSQVQVDILKEVAEGMGLTVVEKTVSAVGDVQQATEALVTQVDVIYAPTDNIIASSMSVVADVATPAGIPIITGEAGMCENGGLATYGLSYYNLGVQTAGMALRILNEGANPAEMPIESQSEAELVINSTTASMLGIEIPEEILANATIVE